MQVYQKCHELGYGDIDEFHAFLEEVGIECSRSTAGEYSRRIKIESQRTFQRIREAWLLTKIFEEAGTIQDLSVFNALLLENRLNDVASTINFSEQEIKELETKDKLAVLKLIAEVQNHATSIIAKAKPGRTQDNAIKQQKSPTQANDTAALRSTYMSKILKLPLDQFDVLYPRTDAGAGPVAESDAEAES